MKFLRGVLINVENKRLKAIDKLPQK